MRIYMGKLIKPTDKWGSLSEIEELLKTEKDVILAKKLNAMRLMMSCFKRKEVAFILISANQVSKIGVPLGTNPE